MKLIFKKNKIGCDKYDVIKFVAIMVTIFIYSSGTSQNTILNIGTPFSTEVSANFRSPSQYSVAAQRLLLQLSSTYYTVAKEGQVDLDNSLIYASKSLGLSRLPILAEGIENDELIKESQWVDKRNSAKGINLLSTAKGKRHLELLVLIGAYYDFEPDSYHNYKDSVLYYLNQAIQESRSLRAPGLERVSLCLMGKMYVQANDLQHGDAIVTQLIKLSHDLKDTTNEARAWVYRLYTAYTLLTLAPRLGYLEKARAIYHQQNNINGEINVLTNICYLNTAAYNIGTAYNASEEALALAQHSHFLYVQYNEEDVAMVSMIKGEFGEPLKYTLESIKTAESTRDSIGWAYFYNRLGSLYATENELGQAIIWEAKAQQRFLISKESSFLNLFDLTVDLVDLGRTKEAWGWIEKAAKITPPATISDQLFYYLSLQFYYSSDKIRKYQESYSYLLKADSLERQIEKTGPATRRFTIIFLFGDFYFRKGELAKPKPYFESYLKGAAYDDNLTRRMLVLHDLISIDSLNKDQSIELHDYEQFTKLEELNFGLQKQDKRKN
jgi:hypothetical protein